MVPRGRIEVEIKLGCGIEVFCLGHHIGQVCTLTTP